MHRKIDWYSCTFKRWDSWQPDHLLRKWAALSDLRAIVGDTLMQPFYELAWDEMPGRAPFAISIGADEGGIRIFGGEKVDYWLLEVSGRGCDHLRAWLMLKHIIDATSERVTRLDIACDLPGGPTPDEFVSAGYSGRIKAHSRMQSKTGTTHYVGSPKSDRFARVYSYDKPHPRAGVTRVEMVLRKKYARGLLEQTSASEIEFIADSIGNAFDWKHSVWTEAASEAAPLSVPSPDRRTGATEKWLISQAAPAFQRLVKEGAINDPVKWLSDWFIAGLDDFLEDPYY